MTAIEVIIAVVLGLVICAVFCFVVTFAFVYYKHHGVDICDYLIRYIDWIEGLVERLDKEREESKQHDAL